MDRITDDQLIGVLQAWRRLTSWTAAGELAAVAELSRRRADEVATGADPHLAEHVGDELAVSLTLTARGADHLLDFAARLDRLPRTRAALAAGEIDRSKAYVIADEVSCLDHAHATAVEAAVIGRAPGQTTGQLRASARRPMLAADPAATDRHREKAEKEARVEVWSEPSGTAALAGAVNLTMPLSSSLGASGQPGEVADFGPVAVRDCLHERESVGYQPSPTLRHGIRVRPRTCSFPGCRRPAARCDQDHTVPYDQGVRTCECNLAPLCRRHHRAKQVQGWLLDQPEPGVLAWTLPHGRSYQVQPPAYPGDGADRRGPGGSAGRGDREVARGRVQAGR
jgi:hypothetical protein